MKIVSMLFLFLLISILVMDIPHVSADVLSNKKSPPVWIKNIFIWYVEHEISRSEFDNALKFLIDTNVIKSTRDQHIDSDFVLYGKMFYGFWPDITDGVLDSMTKLLSCRSQIFNYSNDLVNTSSLAYLNDTEMQQISSALTKSNFFNTMTSDLLPQGSDENYTYLSIRQGSNLNTITVDPTFRYHSLDEQKRLEQLSQTVSHVFLAHC